MAQDSLFSRCGYRAACCALYAQQRLVGLIAVIRFILVVLTPGGQGASAAELGLLIGMVAVFVAGLIAVTLVEKGADRDGGDQPL